MGGFGCFKIAAKYPNRFAGFVAVAGGGDAQLADRLVNTPLWAVHGSADKRGSAENSTRIVDAIHCAGGQPKGLNSIGKVVRDKSFLVGFSNKSALM